MKEAGNGMASRRRTTERKGRARRRALSGLAIVFAACLAAVLTIILAPAPVPFFVCLVLVVSGALLATLTAGVGVAITYTTPPLKPLSEVSVFAKRALQLGRFALATVAILGAAYVSALFQASVATPTRAAVSSTLITAEQFILLVVAVGAIGCWLGLSVDLLRIGSAGRRHAVEELATKAENALGLRLPPGLRTFASWLVDEWGWILCAFYIAPLVAAGALYGAVSLAQLDT